MIDSTLNESRQLATGSMIRSIERCWPPLPPGYNRECWRGGKNVAEHNCTLDYCWHSIKECTETGHTQIVSLRFENESI